MRNNAFDGSVVQLVPQQVEKLPLYHWKPGSRLLCVSSRDGAAFASTQREFNLIDTRQVLGRKVSVGAESHTFIEVFNESIVELVHGNERTDRENREGRPPKESHPVRNDEVTQAIEPCARPILR